MSDPAPESAPVAALSLPLAVADLPTRHPRRFHLRPDPGQRAELADMLDLLALRKLDFRGRIEADGLHDWRLEGVLGATVVQPCVISAEPVVTRLDVPVLRRFLRRMPDPETDESEMPDDTLEPLGAVIDPGSVMAEALSLALPDYPRAAGLADHPDQDREPAAVHAPPPGAAPIARTNPFAVLRSLDLGSSAAETPAPDTAPDTDDSQGGGQT